MKTVTSVVVSKYRYKGLQPLNGKMMMFDFPFKRPTYYRLVLKEGCSVDVSYSRYLETRIGDTITTECMELQDFLLIAGIVVFIVLILAAIFL